MKNNNLTSSKGARLESLRKRLLISSRIVAAVMSVIFGVLLVGSRIAYANESLVTAFLKQDFVNYINLDSEDDEEIDSEYYKSEFESVAEVREAGMALTEKVAEEGVVLLKNGNDKNGNPVLPLNKSTDKVTLFSATSARPVWQGGREQYEKRNACDADLYSGLKTAGITVNADLYNWYKDQGKEWHKGYGWKKWGIFQVSSISEAPWNVLPASKLADGYNTAVFVLGRIAGEGVDATSRSLGADANDKKNGDYLILNDDEREILRNIKQQKDDGRFNKFILIMNTTNQVQLDFLDEYGVDAVVYCGSLGSRGAKAVGNILAGNVNPSGKLSDTFWKDHHLNPTLANFGAMQFNGENAGQRMYTTFTYDDNFVYDNGYTVYQEGIYSGYRYTETRYEDYVLGTKNVGDFNYYDAVAYPFGYGLSYTDFDYSDMNVTYDEETDEYAVSVKVTNGGSVAGKHAVQLFLQKPYTDYDREKGIGQAAVNLVDFAKTARLAAGDSETVEMRVARRELATYDSYGERTYILEQGDYYLTVAQDAHEAVNNILAVKATAEQKARMDASGDEALVANINDVTEGDYKKYSVSATGEEITNVFDDADITVYDDGKLIKGDFAYVTRDNWEGTVKFAFDENNNYLNNYVKLTKTETLNADMYKKVQGDNGKYPTYGASKKWQLIDLRVDDNGDPIPYDDPRWDELLDSLTFDEQATLLSGNLEHTFAIDSIGKPATNDYDSDTGVIGSYDRYASGLATVKNDPDKGKTPAAYNDNGIVGATRNKELCLEYGVQWGEDCLWAGYTALYGTGANIHRNPYLGRSYGYFSEDPVITGACIAEINKGMESKGSYMLLKHCVLNEQESNRCGGACWANEQSIREIYLKPFQISIERGEVQGVMTSLTRIGAVPAPHHDFLNKCLRDEFGMRGYVVTDTYMPYMNIVSCVVAGNNKPISDDDSLKNYKTGYSNVAWAMRDRVHEILYTVVHSSAMNGFTTNVRIVSFEPEWIHLLRDVVMPTVTVLAIICMAFFVAMEVWRLFWKRIPDGNYTIDKYVLRGNGIKEYNEKVISAYKVANDEITKAQEKKPAPEKKEKQKAKPPVKRTPEERVAMLDEKAQKATERSKRYAALAEEANRKAENLRAKIKNSDKPIDGNV